MKLRETHKDVYDELRKSCFGIKRTEMDFSRLPIDLTLQQTSISARQRWAHFVRMKVLSEVLIKLDMTTKEDVSKAQPNNEKY